MPFPNHQTLTARLLAGATGAASGPLEARAGAAPELLARRRPLLSAAEERDAAQQLAESDRDVVELIAASAVAIDCLATLLEPLARGRVGLTALVRLAPDGRDEREQTAAAWCGATVALQQAQRASAGGRSSNAELALARQRFAEAFASDRLSARALTELVRSLEARAFSLDTDQRAELTGTARQLGACRERAELARTTLIEANLPLVVWLANRRAHPGLGLSDLIQEGSIGLMRAVEKYDHRRGLRFATYAVWWIRHAMNRALSSHSRAIRVPVRLLGLRSRLLREIQAYSLQHGREPTHPELAELTGVPLARIATALALPKSPLSFETPLHQDEDAKLGDSVSDTERASALDALVEQNTRQHVWRLLEALAPRERAILELRFGIEGGSEMTLAEIGARFSLTRERIRQIEARALKKLRERAAAEGIELRLAS